MSPESGQLVILSALDAPEIRSTLRTGVESLKPTFRDPPVWIEVEPAEATALVNHPALPEARLVFVMLHRLRFTQERVPSGGAALYSGFITDLRARTGAAIIAISGIHNDEELSSMTRAGATAAFSLPFSWSQIAPVVNDAWTELVVGDSRNSVSGSRSNRFVGWPLVFAGLALVSFFGGLRELDRAQKTATGGPVPILKMTRDGHEEVGERWSDADGVRKHHRTQAYMGFFLTIVFGYVSGVEACSRMRRS